MATLNVHEQQRLEKLVAWGATRGRLDAAHEEELRKLVAKQFPREAQRYHMERLVMLALGMMAAYVVIRVGAEDDEEPALLA